MRQIKFKYYMQHEDTGYITSKIFELEELESYDGFQEPHRYFTLKRCQFTGLSDKQGVEIYEGDILKVANGSGNGVIRFETYEIKCFPKGFNLPYFCWKSDGSDDSDWSHYCEVIGNIYEHSHLLDNN